MSSIGFRHILRTSGGFARCLRALARARSCLPPRWRWRRSRQPIRAAQADSAASSATIAHWFGEQASEHRFRSQGRRLAVSRISATKPALPPRRPSIAAKDAADAVGAFPTPAWSPATRNAMLAPNGAPDCVAAANAICKAKGFDIRQERRHDHRRDLPAARSIWPAATAARAATPRPSSPARSANSIRRRAPAAACAAARACVSVSRLKQRRSAGEPSCQTA